MKELSSGYLEECSLDFSQIQFDKSKETIKGIFYLKIESDPYIKVSLELDNDDKLSYYQISSTRDEIRKRCLKLTNKTNIKKESDKEFYLIDSGIRYQFNSSSAKTTDIWIDRLNNAIHNSNPAI